VIVECSECQTRFQLDDSRVPAAGIRVRCSRCKHAFFLKPPGQSKADGIHAAAAEAAAAGKAPTPRTTQDLPGPARSAPPGSRGAAEGDDEESDWEFNEEIPDPSAKEESGGGFQPSLDGLDADQDREAGGEEHDFGADDLERGGLASGSAPDPQVDPLDGVDADEPQAVAVQPSYTGRPGSGERDETAFGSVDELGDLGGEDPVASGTRASGGEALDDPESWDFFGDAQPSAPRAGIVLGVLGVRGADAADDASAHAAPTQGAEPVGLDSVPVRDLRPGRLAPWLGGLGNGLGWLATLGLLAFGLFHGLWPAWKVPAERGQTSLASGLQPEGVAVRWVESAHLGRLMVVTGGLRAPAGRATAAVGTVEVALLDASGQALPVAGSPVGSPLPEIALREWQADALDDGRVRAARELASREVSPGQVVPFQAVLVSVPFDAQRFDIRQAGPPPQPVPAQVAEPDSDPAQPPEGELDLIESAAEATETLPR